MSTPAQKNNQANLARIRDNQRRSRARRREYMQELEQRIRNFEHQGAEVTAEVQMAARRVVEENRQLRELLNKHGISDDYIAQYLQVGTAAPPPDPGSGHRFSTGDPGPAVQSLQHLIATRRPVGLESSVPFPLPVQVTRGLSTASMSTTGVSTGGSSSWDPQHSAMPYAHQQTVNVAPPQPVQAVPTVPHQYAPFPQVSPAGAMLEDISEHSGTTQPTVSDNPAAMTYNLPMHPYHNPAPRDFAPQGGYY